MEIRVSNNSVSPIPKQSGDGNPSSGIQSIPLLRASVTPIQLLLTTQALASNQQLLFRKTLAECQDTLSQLHAQSGAYPHSQGKGMLGRGSALSGMPIPPLSPLTTIAASTLLCRPFSDSVSGLWSDATHGVHGLSSIHNGGSNPSPLPPPPVSSSSSPLDDDVLTHSLLLDIAFSMSRKESNFSIADADWVLAKYIDTVLCALSSPIALDRTLSLQEPPPVGTAVRHQYFKPDVSGLSPSGFYDSLIDDVNSEIDKLLLALDKGLSETLSSQLDNASIALRQFNLSQQALNRKDGKHSIASIMIGDSRSGQVSSEGNRQPSLASAAMATAAATVDAAAMLANTVAPVSERIQNLLAFIKLKKSARDGPLQKVGVHAKDVYSNFCNQILHTCRDREKQEGKASQLATGLDGEESSSASGMWSQQHMSSYASLLTSAVSSLLPEGASACHQPPAASSQKEEDHSGVGSPDMARLFVTMQLLRRLASFGLCAFLNHKSPHESPFQECYALAKTHTPELMPLLGDRLRVQQTCPRIVGLCKNRPKGVAPLPNDSNVVSTADDPIGHLLNTSLSLCPQLGYLAPIVHRFSSSLPTLASVNSAAEQQRVSQTALNVSLGRFVSTHSAAKEMEVKSAPASIQLPSPTTRPVVDLLTALQERVGDRKDAGNVAPIDAPRHQLPRLLFRNSALERENDELRKGLQMQSQLLSQLSSKGGHSNPLKEMALIQSQLVKTLGDVTATLKALRSNDGLL